MCGIAGFYGFKNDNLIKKISQQLAHRGPDGEGYFFDNKVTLLNRRLAIIDLKGGDQPIYNEDKSVVTVYNGEIYNYQKLRRTLERKGHEFKTQSDTEVIVHGYEEWKEECFDKFNGMFAIGLYDKKEDKFILARDHFGIKPLYYSTISTGGPLQLIFSSEIKPIFYSGFVEKKPNDKVIYRYLKYRVHDDSEETFFAGINKLLPGQLMVVQSAKFQPKADGLLAHKIQNYSNLQKTLLENKKNEALNKSTIEEFGKMLIQAIRLRLISDVPVGTCLSGGLDSSTVVTVVNQLLKKRVKEASSVGKIQKSFSAVFPGQINDEEKYINSLLKQLNKNVKSYKVKPTAEEFFKEIEDFIKTQEEPTISTGPYAQYKVMQEASKYVKVLLDGQGADEMMAGYLPYYFIYLKQLLKEAKYLTFLKETFLSYDVIFKFFWPKFLTKIGVKRNIDIRKILKKKFQDEFATETFKTENSNLKKRFKEDIFKNSLPSLLRYEDKNSMRFSIEGRVPFLDFNLLSYIFSLENKAIIKDGWNKYVLRQAVKDLIPFEIAHRRNKIGFTTPEEAWFLRMKNQIYTVFMSESFEERKYFNQDAVVKAFEQFIEGKTDDTMLFWRLLNTELWLRLFFDSKVKVDEQKEKGFFDPNLGKKLEIKVDSQNYLRFPIKTELFQKEDNLNQKLYQSLYQLINQLIQNEQYKNLSKRKWFVVVSEKIVAITQGRSYFIWEIKPGFFARTLYRFVRKTPYGIGLGSTWTMQLAIDEVGLTRILAASFVSFLTKPFGFKGLFYRVAGRQAASIDGPTEYSLYPSNLSAKLGPKEPENTARDIHQYLKRKLPKDWLKQFHGVVIIDANDLGQNVLGNSTYLCNIEVEKIFKDNPMGQGSEQTPLVAVFLV